MNRWLKGLNPEQRKAVKTVDGPVLVLAGAGSGKTRVITHRVAHMLDLGVDPDNILAVTFTNKAAGEMRERLSRMVGPLAGRVTLSTFHSLGLGMLRAEAKRRRRGTRFVIFDAGDQIACLRELGMRLRLGRNFDLGAILARISAWKNAFVEPGQEQVGDDPYQQAAAAFYPAYVEALEAFAAVDFDDLICKPTRMMERAESCKRRWADRYRYVLVDEYQDTNGAQLRMLRAIAGDHRNLCVVGDDDQSIYGWRGAEVRNILRFEQDFPGCTKVYLHRNYRSVSRVLELANEVIAANEQRHPKELTATRGEGPMVRLVVSEDGEAEAAWAADHLREALDSKKYRAGQMAILYRSNILSRGLESALRSRRIAYRVLGGKSFFDRKEVKDLTAYMRLCVNPADSISLRRVINFPARGIGPQTMARLSAWSDDRQLPLHKALERAGEVLGKADRALPSIKGFLEMLGTARKRLRSGRDLGRGIGKLIEELGLRDEVHRTCASGAAFERRWMGVTEFVEGVQAYADRASRPSLREFLGQITLAELDKDADDGPTDRVTLATLHGAKGLEFELVLLVGVEEGILPHDRVLNPHASDAISGDLAEERRLCYVGITRARDELILTRAARRQLHGKLRERAPSRFVADLAPELLRVEDLAAPLSADDARSRLAEIKALLTD